MAILTDLWGTKSIFSLAMFFITSNDIKYFIRLVISTDPGARNIVFVLRCLLVHCVLLNILPPYHFLHYANYIDYFIPSVIMIDPVNTAVVVPLLLHVHLHNPSGDFPLLISVDTHNIASSADYYSVECLYPMFFVSPLEHMVQ